MDDANELDYSESETHESSTSSDSDSDSDSDSLLSSLNSDNIVLSDMAGFVEVGDIVDDDIHMNVAEDNKCHRNHTGNLALDDEDEPLASQTPQLQPQPGQEVTLQQQQQTEEFNGDSTSSSVSRMSTAVVVGAGDVAADADDEDDEQRELNPKEEPSRAKTHAQAIIVNRDKDSTDTDHSHDENSVNKYISVVVVAKESSNSKSMDIKTDATTRALPVQNTSPPPTTIAMETEIPGDNLDLGNDDNHRSSTNSKNGACACIVRLCRGVLVAILLCMAYAVILAIPASIAYGGVTVIWEAEDIDSKANSLNIRGECECIDIWSEQHCEDDDDDDDGGSNDCSTDYFSEWKVFELEPCANADAAAEEQQQQQQLNGASSSFVLPILVIKVPAKSEQKEIGDRRKCFTDEKCQALFATNARKGGDADGNQYHAKAGWTYFGAVCVFLTSGCFCVLSAFGMYATTARVCSFERSFSKNANTNANALM